MPVSRAAWEDAISELKENTRQKNINKTLDKIISPKTGVQKAEQAAGSLGGLVGGAAQTIMERKRKQQELLDSY